MSGNELSKFAPDLLKKESPEEVNKAIRQFDELCTTIDDRYVPEFAEFWAMQSIADQPESEARYKIETKYKFLTQLTIQEIGQVKFQAMMARKVKNLYKQRKAEKARK